MCMFNWLWYETTTFLPYTEETSYENSLLVQQTGALALSSLTHVLRSLTSNARYNTVLFAFILITVLYQESVLVWKVHPVCSFHRGIFRLLAEFQLENKDNPSYTGKTVDHTLIKDSLVFHVLFNAPFLEQILKCPVIFFSLLAGVSFYISVMICVQGCLFKIFISVVVRPSWWTVTSRWGLSWQNSGITSWSARRRWINKPTFWREFIGPGEYVHRCLHAEHGMQALCIFWSHYWNSRCFFFFIIMRTRQNSYAYYLI